MFVIIIIKTYWFYLYLYCQNVLQIEEYSNKVANAMLECGFKKGDVVGLLMENRPEFVGIWLGMSKVGIVTALINYNQKLLSLAHSVNVANCCCLIYGSELTSGAQNIYLGITNAILSSLQTYPNINV